MPEQRQAPGLAVETQDRDAVMAAIGAVNEAPAGMDRDPRAMVVRRALGYRGDDVDQVEAAAVGVIAQGGDPRVEVADDNGDATIGAEGEMAWATTRRQGAAHRAPLVQAARRPAPIAEPGV